ncbi:MAG TPA: TonB family protein [Vicinamibacterales bacterium]|jgi:TonB family protein|nr:TonB family protein [Vicinamibacterales bacterium]
MREAVSDVLDLRMREPDGLSRMVLVSMAAHAAILSVIVLMPASWRMGTVQKKETPMMISLGGAVGPNAGGMTQMSNRSVQAVAPPEAKPRAQPQPAAKVPEMTVPDLTKAPPKPALKPVDKPADKSSSRKVTTGPEVKTGDARAETGSKPIPFGGLSTGGGGTGGVQLDIGDFCCPDYIVTMNQRIRENWKQNQGMIGSAVVKFVIRRDGMLTNVEVEQSSRNEVLDLESRRAVLMTQRLPPLPAQFDQPTLTVHLKFEYTR